MMGAPDFGPLVLIVWTILSIPIVLAGIATLLAGSTGADAAAKLTKGRHLLATMCGTLAGWLVLAGFLLLGLQVVAALRDIATALVSLGIVLLLASVLAATAGYWIGKAFGVMLTRYKCMSCGGVFRTNVWSPKCKMCIAEDDRSAAEWAHDNFESKIRELGIDDATPHVGEH